MQLNKIVNVSAKYFFNHTVIVPNYVWKFQRRFLFLYKNENFFWRIYNENDWIQVKITYLIYSWSYYSFKI